MLRETTFTMDPGHMPGDTCDALIEAARALLTRGNTLLRSEHGILALQAGIGRQHHAAALACVGLDSAQGRLLIAVERDQTDHPLGDARWQDYAGEARLLAWSLSYEPVLDALSHVFGGGFVATHFFADGAESEALWLALSWQSEEGQSLQGWLGLGVAEAHLLGACADWKRDPSKLSMLGDASVLTFELMLQGRALDPTTLSALAPGDVLLVSEDADCEAQLQADSDTSRSMFGLPDNWPVQRRQGQWTIAAKPLLSSSADPTRPRFRLTRLQLSPEQAGALQPGNVLSYDASLPGNTVDILLGDQYIGAGVLVTLGEWLGVRIADLDTTQKGSTRGFQ
jgi:type III secretion protein Q